MIVLLENNSDYHSISGIQINKLKELISNNSELKGINPKEGPKLPSSRRKEAHKFGKTLRNYQNLRRSIFEDQRKTNYTNNRWRESAGKIINSMRGENRPKTTGQRIKAFYKYERNHK